MIARIARKVLRRGRTGVSALTPTHEASTSGFTPLSIEPDWVAALCGVALRYREADQTISGLVEAACPETGNSALFLSAVTHHLRAHPDLITAWSWYSMDKRTSGAYFELGETSEVGTLGAGRGGGRYDLRRYMDPADACADFLWREFGTDDQATERLRD